MRRLLDWIQNQDRAIQWAIYAGVLLLVFLLVIDPVMQSTSALRAEADALATRNNTYEQTLEEREGKAGTAALASVRHGAALALPAANDAGVAIPNLFAELEQKYRISGWRIDPRIATLSDATLKERFAPAPNQIIQRLIYRLTFDAKSDVARDILADLESSDQVTAVGLVSWRTGGDLSTGSVSVQLEAETWAIGERGRR